MLGHYKNYIMNKGIFNITCGVVMFIFAAIRIHNDEMLHAIIDLILAATNIIIGYLLYFFNKLNNK